METDPSPNVTADAERRFDGQLLKTLTGAGVLWLDRNQEAVNRLNVFPVPDGDTGTNMLLTMREAQRELAPLTESRIDVVARAAAYGALNGARGNSGTILSQLWEGFARTLDGHEVCDAALFVQACRSAVTLGYQSVVTPVEGTILTVAREAAEHVERRAAAGEANLYALLKAMVFAARRALRRTPELLPVLKSAGVVDSGGQGLVYLLEGMLRYLSGRQEAALLIAQSEAPPGHWQQALEPDDQEGYGYDVQFRMHGANLDVEAIRQAIDDIGWSTVVVGNDRLVKVHVHVHDPGKPITYAIGLGVEIDDVVVENMQMQYLNFVQDRLAREQSAEAEVKGAAVIVVAPGVGLRRLFLEQLGAARVITGGQTMNPSTGEFLSCMRSLPNTDIILLPNNKNVIMAAEQAANLVEDKQVRVVRSRSVPQGISAMVEYGNLDPDTEIDAVAEAMQTALKSAITAEITTATRSVEIGGVSVREGQLIGLLEGELVVAGEALLPILRDLLRKANADKRELITLYYGNDTHRAKVQALVDELAADYPEQIIEIVYGGQALYPFIISIE